MADIQPKFLSEPDAAKFLALSRKTLQRYRTRGGGPDFCKLGGRIVYPVDALSSWALGNLHQSTSSYGV